MRHALINQGRVSKPKNLGFQPRDLEYGQVIVLTDLVHRSPVVSILCTFVECNSEKITVLVPDGLLEFLYPDYSNCSDSGFSYNFATFNRRDFWIHECTD